MRFFRSSWSIPSGLLVTAVWILIAGAAGAVLDADVDIDPNSPGYDGSGGHVDASGSSFGSSVYFVCIDADNDFEIYCETDHPDKLRLSARQGTVEQGRKGNNANAVMDVGVMGGIAENTQIPLSCERVEVKGRSNDGTERVEARCTLKGCDIPGELTVGQIQSAVDCIDAAVANGNLGKKVQNLKLNDDNEIGGRIRSKGVWD